MTTIPFTDLHFSGRNGLFFDGTRFSITGKFPYLNSRVDVIFDGAFLIGKVYISV